MIEKELKDIIRPWEAGRTYTVKVKALGDAVQYNDSEYSNSITTTFNMIDAPTGLRITTDYSTSWKSVLSWNAISSASSYDLYYLYDSSASGFYNQYKKFASTTTTSCILNNYGSVLPKYTDITIKVVAVSSVEGYTDSVPSSSVTKDKRYLTKQLDNKYFEISGFSIARETEPYYHQARIEVSYYASHNNVQSTVAWLSANRHDMDEFINGMMYIQGDNGEIHKDLISYTNLYGINPSDFNVTMDYNSMVYKLERYGIRDSNNLKIWFRMEDPDGFYDVENTLNQVIETQNYWKADEE